MNRNWSTSPRTPPTNRMVSRSFCCTRSPSPAGKFEYNARASGAVVDGAPGAVAVGAA